MTRSGDGCQKGTGMQSDRLAQLLAEHPYVITDRNGRVLGHANVSREEAVRIDRRALEILGARPVEGTDTDDSRPPTGGSVE